MLTPGLCLGLVRFERFYFWIFSFSLVLSIVQRRGFCVPLKEKKSTLSVFSHSVIDHDSVVFIALQGSFIEFLGGPTFSLSASVFLFSFLTYVKNDFGNPQRASVRRHIQLCVNRLKLEFKV